ncbi:MAG: hypothetical protein E7018_04315 [Alphaproteobacteria bacterium]|nr:hypothetical protein [Alphaproteobacteria bacterium]
MKLAKFVCRLVFVVAAVIAFLSVAFLLADHFAGPDPDRGDRAMNMLVVSCVICALAVVVNAWIEERENPVDDVVKRTALRYVVEKEMGTRQEFLSLYGVFVYEYFLDEGYIHQLLKSKENRWEVTMRGKLEKQSFD